MELIITLTIIAFMAFLCYKIAEKNGRSKDLAIFLGIFFGIFAVIGYLIIGETELRKIERIKKYSGLKETEKEIENK